MPFETSQTEQGAILSLKDEVTVAEAAELKDALVKLIKEESCFALDAGQTTELDTSIIQLLFSAFKAAKEQGVEMPLTGRAEAFKNAMERTGILADQFSTGEQ
ncbi:hypothetical protein BuS5_02315 [Desulfosarcina sp. BuS5]|uniref:STAS domain-containing protein n=1 Tax=Desulfosarcina sp. BuS5 TaxID=933262 RepID=UPI0004832208|nr:STAS domain-containing protein [Desulfosarcina sp. BuS5]WDN89347.1 hypothetical protein BuS5_02315 [Desulfosarcina sp. BuS5]